MHSSSPASARDRFRPKREVYLRRGGAKGVTELRHPARRRRPGTKGEKMTRSRVRLAALIGGVAALIALGTPATARADTVTDWNQTAFNALNVTAVGTVRSLYTSL